MSAHGKWGNVGVKWARSSEDLSAVMLLASAQIVSLLIYLKVKVCTVKVNRLIDINSLSRHDT